ncbi:MAG: iron-sulfur cluster assembly scaffold protein [Dehalococcoidia bacterium]|nr:iron-sulfur cluster assembly scaffold protein [Dehalococcoidia bacterium]
MVRGWTLEEVESLTRERIAEAIGGLPGDKVHCSVLAADALRGAIADYRSRTPEFPRAGSLTKERRSASSHPGHPAFTGWPRSAVDSSNRLLAKHTAPRGNRCTSGHTAAYCRWRSPSWGRCSPPLR